MTELTAFSQNQYESDWKKTDSLMGLGQSKTALEIVNRIYDETKQQSNNPQFLKASIYKMSIKSTYEEDNLAKNIEETKADLKTATFPVNSVLHSILAELYWQFYQNNRYQFLNRTELEGDTSTDILTWSARRLADECVIHYNASLENSDQLKSVNVNSIDAILRLGYITRNLRPSLFDFLAHRAIDFYINTETGLTRPADIFTIDNLEYFALSDKFSTLEIQSSYQASFDYNALKLFQSVVVFHLTDKDPSALVDLEIKRLNFIHNSSILPEKDSLMMQALKLLEKKYADYPCYTEIAYRRALLLTETAVKYKPLVSDDHKWDFREARQLAQSAADKYPDSYDAKSCQALVNSISYPTLDINQEFASSPGKPALALVSSKNIDKIFIRLIKTTPQNDREIMENSNGRPNDIYCKMKPDREWLQELPIDGDFQPHACEIAIPPMEQGYYIMLSSNNSNFPADSILSINKLWRTNISYISRRNDDGSYSLFLTGREDGQPLKKVKIQSFFREYDYNSRKYNEKPGVELFTDKDGFATVPSRNRDRENQYYLQFTYGKEQFMTENYFYGYSYKYDGLNKVISTSLFTDRAIYRPGQTVFFKGIVTEREDKEVRIVPAYKSTITFFDVNGQKLSSLELTTNEYGSFSGSFTIPSGTLTGSMNLQSVNGAISILVEEYKRPKFEVRFNPVKGAYKLGEQLNVTGKAVAYAGNNISDAQVKYRVVRTANFPYRWWGWFYWLPDSPEMEIVHGTTISDQKGEFKISFLAAPDLSLDRKWNPVFSYRVIAEVTDINGETHESETTVSVGYKSLLVNLGIPENVDLGELKPYSLSTTNLNGEKEVAKGELKIWKLKNPDIVFKSRLWNQPDRFVAGQGQFRKQFPNDVYSNEDDFSSWTKETLAYSSAFNTATDSTVLLKGLNPGRYKYEITTSDAFGEKIESSGSFLAFSANSITVPANQASWFTILNNTVEPGDTAEILIGTAASNVKAVFEVFQNDRVISKELISLNKEQRLMRIPIKEEYRGNISVNLVFIQMNRSYQNSGVIQVPWTNKKLDIEIASFRSKLTPGQEEEWKITVRGSKGEKLAAELLAGMYDASLDAFASHEWNFSLFNSINRQLPWEISSAFGSRGSSNYTFPYNYYSRNTRLYDELNWFGLNFHYRVMYSKGLGMASSVNEEKSALISREMPAMVSDEAMLDKTPVAKEQEPIPPSESKKQTDPGVSKIRTDFKETAFFYPQMSTDENGSLVLHFTIPESLTKWRMMGLAYTKDLKIGQIEKSLVTQKDLMVFPNLPRFFREGDHMVFSTKVSSLINSSMKGSATLHFFNAYTMQPIDSLILTEPATKDFSIEASSSTVVNWKITIPEGIEAITYRITASGNTMSDGEEGVIPVLSNRILVTESMPLPVNGNQSKSFTFKKLLDSGKGSNTLRNYRLSLEYTSNPAWYAVQALPYLMEYPYECAEQVFSRYYANSLATFIANSDPKIKAVFESWKKLTPAAFQSNLEKNQELKSILLEESPWVREANNETERKQRIALLFDLNKWKVSSPLPLRS
ncbi:MAG: hypothetical protein IPH88_02730 [Bacteroidales bacterium]|nr:hypothetical protein [Bacteroidales bacterium]